MNLTDSDILDLNELCNAVVDGTLTEKQKASLSHWLLTSEDARQFYVRVTGLSASLCHYAGEMQTGEPDTLALHPKTVSRWRRVISLLSVAAVVMVVLWIGSTKRRSDTALAEAVDDGEFVARLTGSKNCQWSHGFPNIPLGGRLHKGQKVELASGFAEITFDSGAQVLLQGPASLDVNSAWSATLNSGALRASLPREANGFSISNSTVEVVDIGTEFTMFADSGGAAADVLVLKGEVSASPKVPVDQQFIVLREKDARRFAPSGVSTIHNSEQKFGALTQPVQLDYFATPIGYAHWSFDETSGDAFKSISVELPHDAPDVQVERTPKSASSAIHAKGRFQGAMRFDGNLYAKTQFHGISDNQPHTVAFWVNVPKDANPSSAYAMVAWGADSKKFGSHPFHIGWNRNRDDGLLGVLRTDYGRGFAVGMTPLRDGLWHHIAVVFIPREDAESPMEVKQYVDGRLDGEGKPSPPGSDIFMSSTDNNVRSTSGMIWLGCRLGIKGVRTDRFFGEMDELFIADHALEPQEIVRLMSSNRL